jgi:hypothetical protein
MRLVEVHPAKNIEWDWASALTRRDWREQTEVFKDVAMVLPSEGSKVKGDGK